MFNILISIGILLSLFNSTDAKEQLIVPLSSPGSAAKLIIKHYKGSINIVGYEGNSVIINAELRHKNTKTNNGLVQVQSHQIQLSAVELNNEITVKTNSMNRTIDLNVQIPVHCSLNLQSYDDGNILVKGIIGELEISNISGNIKIHNMIGSAILNTVDGDIVSHFEDISPNVPMAFTTVEGEVELTFPPNTRALLKIKSDHGEIFSNTQMDIQPRKIKTENDAESGIYRYSLEEWIYGKINGGGPEYLIKSFNGNIHIKLN